MNTPLQPSGIRFHVESIFLKEVKELPWQLPISDWRSHGVDLLNVKRGPSRHVVIFVKAGRFSFGIKEINEEAAKKEIRNYEELLLRGIHTLVPVGYVVREGGEGAAAAAVGNSKEKGDASHTITLLVEKVLPDSQLYPRGFTLENRKRIWDAIAELFVELHSNGVYWGDASLANTLIRFEKAEVPFIGRRTSLKAYLADAETVEFKQAMSAKLREEELNFFFDSMDWLNKDLRGVGKKRDELEAIEDRLYLQERYRHLVSVEEKKRDFERRTSIDVNKFLGAMQNPTYFDLLMKHIEEHKWYLGERTPGTVSLKDATLDWYQNVYRPACELFRKEGIVDFFPGKTASELYIEIMTNKYYMSEQLGKDVGMFHAMKDYAEKFGVEQLFMDAMKSSSQSFLSIFGQEE